MNAVGRRGLDTGVLIKDNHVAAAGLQLGTAAAVAHTGVDFSAVGAVTHSASVLDIGLDVSGTIGSPA